MKRFTITLTVDVPEESSELEVRNVLLDSFAEFENPRLNPESYVVKRYPLSEGYAWLERDEKIAEVTRRVKISRELHHATFEADIAYEAERIMELLRLNENRVAARDEGARLAELLRLNISPQPVVDRMSLTRHKFDVLFSSNDRVEKDCEADAVVCVSATSFGEAEVAGWQRIHDGSACWEGDPIMAEVHVVDIEDLGEDDAG